MREGRVEGDEEDGLGVELRKRPIAVSWWVRLGVRGVEMRRRGYTAMFIGRKGAMHKAFDLHLECHSKQSWTSLILDLSV